MRRRATPEPVDLFRWRVAADIEARRQELSRRINKLKPNAWRRIELQAELRQLTSEALKLETRDGKTIDRPGR
jgi:hypothetical protein